MSNLKEKIVLLRELSGRSINLCKEALSANDEDLEGAIDYILDSEEKDVAKIQVETGLDSDNSYKAYEIYGGDVDSAIKNIKNGRFVSEYVKKNFKYAS